MNSTTANPSVSALPYSVTVLRLGHRLVRDERISTHIGLVSRTFGAKSLILTGADDHTVESIQRLNSRWGGNFQVEFTREWRKLASNWRGIVVHLTMYGEAIDEALPRLKGDTKTKNGILVVIGAEKVPAEIYSIAHYNVAVGNQPHSEVAALAVFLDRLFMGAELYTRFINAKFVVRPNSKGKRVVVSDEN